LIGQPPGSEDTELGVILEPEVVYGTQTLCPRVQAEAVRLVKERGVSVAQASRDLGVHANVLREWVRAFAADPEQAFPGRGQTKPDQLEVERLRREVQKLKAERDILKKAAAYFAKEST
jgi:transposase